MVFDLGFHRFYVNLRVIEIADLSKRFYIQLPEIAFKPPMPPSPPKALLDPPPIPPKPIMAAILAASNMALEDDWEDGLEEGLDQLPLPP